jgi:hypothetical protein
LSIKERRNTRNASLKNRQIERRKHIDDDDDDDDENEKDELDTTDDSTTSLRERRFRDFASVEYNEEIYMVIYFYFINL